MTNLDNILKGRDITLPTKVRLVKATVFPVVMYGCESCTAKKAERWRIDAFELWWWRRLLTVVQSVYPKGNQSWIFIGKTDAEAEAPILWPHDGKNWLIGKDPEAEKDWRQEEKGTTENQITGWFQPTQWIWAWASSRRWWRTEKLGMLQSMGLQSQTWLSDWTELTDWKSTTCTEKKLISQT